MPTRVYKDHLGFEGDMCQCGRRQSLIHCIYCGSTRKHARMNRLHTHMNGEKKWVEVQIHCDSCGRDYTHEEREFCNATPVGAADAARKLKMLAEAEGSSTLSSGEQSAAGIAKRLLDELKAVGPTSEAEARAIRVLEKQTAQSLDEQYEEFCRQVAQIKSLYADEVFDYKQKGMEHPDTEEDYIEKALSLYEIKRVPNPKGENNA